jgi:hypothetical protein
MEGRYALSVVVATTVGWPHMRRSTDAILPQLRAVGGQLVVADSSGSPPAPWGVESPDVVWLSRPGAGVFSLRREGYARAAGSVIAATEDHCEIAPDWVRRVLDAHAAHPDVAAIGGAVDNGTTDHLIDWAIYFVTQLPWVAPLEPQSERVVGHTNISYKRWALDSMPSGGSLIIEILFNDWLRDSGRQVIVDDAIRVRHYQCMGLRGTSTLEFHNGRSLGGLRRDTMGARDWVRASAPALMAAYRLLRTLELGFRKPVPRAKLLRTVPYIAWLQAVHALGESVGYLAGPGDSPSRLH